MKDIESARLEDLRVAQAKSAMGKALFPVSGLAILFGMVLWAASWGASSIGAGDVLASVLAKLFPSAVASPGRLADTIVWELRAPRIAMAVVAGAGFAVSGAAMQSILRNPLVSPFTVGISSGAGFARLWLSSWESDWSAGENTW